MIGLKRVQYHDELECYVSFQAGILPMPMWIKYNRGQFSHAHPQLLKLGYGIFVYESAQDLCYWNQTGEATLVVEGYNLMGLPVPFHLMDFPCPLPGTIEEVVDFLQQPFEPHDPVGHWPKGTQMFESVRVLGVLS